MRDNVDPARAAIEKNIRACLDVQGPDISGFAFVVWGHDGACTADLHNEDGVIPEILIPDFVRNVLLSEKIERWTVRRLEDMS